MAVATRVLRSIRWASVMSVRLHTSWAAVTAFPTDRPRARVPHVLKACLAEAETHWPNSPP